jgi:photosystem II stability/assembly factor-like uncharacterized protein
MTDDELGQRLHEELHSRINPPVAAPDAIHEHVANLRSTQEVRRGEPGNRAHSLRNLFAVAAGFAIVTLLTTGLLAWQSLKPRTGTVSPTGGIEMFGRLDSKIAWAESGSDLYVTRDGGISWSRGTVPGGRSLGQLAASNYAIDTPALSTPTPVGPDAGPASSAEPVGANPILGLFPDHLYPTFVDADHGWLLSWTVSNATSLQTAAWTLTVHRTKDGGQTWESTQLPGTYKGYGVTQFVDSQHGWVVVYRMDYAMSAGGGSGPEPSPMPSPTMPSDTTTVLATSDGGVTWSPASTLGALTLMQFTSVSEAWGTESRYSSGGDAVVHSTDGGHTWSRSVLPLPQCSTVPSAAYLPARANGLLELRVECDQTGNVTGGSSPYAVLTFVSADDGHTWTLESTSQIDSAVFNVGMSSVLNLPAGQPIVAYSPNGTSTDTGPMPLKATFDGGKTWTTYPTAGLPSTVTVAEWASPDDVWVMVGPSGSLAGALEGRLYSTANAGKTWTALLGAPAWPASPAPAITPETVYVTNPPLAISSEAPTRTEPMVVSYGRVDAKVGWVVVAESAGSYDVRLTEDGGVTWSEPRAMPSGGDVQFIDADHGWILTSDMEGQGAAGGYSAVVLWTVDGGRTWDKPAGIDLGALQGNPQKTFASTSIHFRDTLHGELYAAFVSSSDGPTSASTASPATAAVCEQFSTADAGATWSKPRSAPCMTPVSFKDASLGYGSDLMLTPVIHVSVDGGQTWIDANLPLAAGVSAGSSNGAIVTLLERRADGTLRAMVSSGNGQAVATIIVSADDGRTWTSAGTAQGFPAYGYAVAWLGEGNWLALGQTPTTGATPFALDARVTDDGGLTWKAITAQGLPAYATTPFFVSATDGWVTAVDPVCDASSTGRQSCPLGTWSLYGTKDGGATWKAILTP